MSKQSLPNYRTKCEFVVWGRAAPRGSVKAIPRGRKVGDGLREDKGTLIIDQESAALKSWMQEIKSTAIQAWSAEHSRYSDRPFQVDIIFRLDRPKTHYRSGRFSDTLKDTAPEYPVVRPDLDKLTRAVNDALTKIVYKDDSQVVDMHVRKIYGFPEGIKVRIYEL